MFPFQRKTILVATAFVLCGVGLTAFSSDNKQGGLVNVMHGLAKTLDKLRVFSDGGPKMTDEELGQELKELKTRIAAVNPDQVPAGRTYRITLKALQQHLAETERIHRVGNQQYAQWMLKATTSLCVMCHTQMPRSQKLQSFWTYKPLAPKGRNAYSDAEFLFVTRRFDEAIPYYDDVIRSYPLNELTPVEIDQSLRRKVTYFARYKRDPAGAIASLEGDLKNQKIPEAIRRNTQAWIGLFRKLSREKKLDLEKMSTTEVLKWANDQFKKTLWDKMIPAEDPRVVTHLYVSGILYETLFTRPSDANTPDFLLLLARSENILNQQFFYSLGDLYLRECVTEFPKSAAAKSCYKDLESSLNEAYRSTTGLQLPEEIKSELKGYRERIGI